MHLCAACHGAQGEGNRQLNAPKLTGLEDWYLQRQLKYFKQGARGTHERGRVRQNDGADGGDAGRRCRHRQRQRLYRDACRPYPPRPRSAEMQTMVERLYVSTCGACHGADGRGVQSTNAPRLKGMNDWYLVTQLKNFSRGVRGTHPQDMYGPQMALMSATLADDQAVNDLVAYINTLR